MARAGSSFWRKLLKIVIVLVVLALAFSGFSVYRALTDRPTIAHDYHAAIEDMVASRQPVEGENGWPLMIAMLEHLGDLEATLEQRAVGAEEEGRLPNDWPADQVGFWAFIDPDAPEAVRELARESMKDAREQGLFEQSARSPLIFRVPWLAANGTPCRRVVEFIDIYPTLLELTGIEPVGELSGRSLLPLLKNPLADWDGYAITQVLRPADDRLPQPVMGCSIRTERWRYPESAEGTAGVELYDHHSDSGEFENLAIDPDPRAQAVISRLRPLLRSHASGEVPDTPFNPARL